MSTAAVSTTVRELVSFFVPEDHAPAGADAPVVNEALTVFPLPPTAVASNRPAGSSRRRAAAAAVPVPRVWDNEQGFFVPAPRPNTTGVKDNSTSSMRRGANTSARHKHHEDASNQPINHPLHQEASYPAHFVQASPPKLKQSQPTRQNPRQKRARRTPAEPSSSPQRSSSAPSRRASASGNVAELSPAPKRFAGSSFEAASPDPNSLPIPKFPLLVRTTPVDDSPPLDVIAVSPDPSPAESISIVAVAAEDSAAFSVHNEVIAMDLRRMLRI